MEYKNLQKFNVNVDFIGPLIVVEDVDASQAFYENVAGQSLLFDLGACRQFKSGLTLQSKDSMENLFGFNITDSKTRSHSFTLYFETEELDDFVDNLRNYALEYVHDVVESDRGQRSVSFYDLDGHVIDVSEKMQAVIKRFLNQGLTAEEIAARTKHPIDFVRTCL